MLYWNIHYKPVKSFYKIITLVVRRSTSGRFLHGCFWHVPTSENRRSWSEKWNGATGAPIIRSSCQNTRAATAFQWGWRDQQVLIINIVQYSQLLSNCKCSLGTLSSTNYGKNAIAQFCQKLRSILFIMDYSKTKQRFSACVPEVISDFLHFTFSCRDLTASTVLISAIDTAGTGGLKDQIAVSSWAVKVSLGVWYFVSRPNLP